MPRHLPLVLVLLLMVVAAPAHARFFRTARSEGGSNTIVVNGVTRDYELFVPPQQKSGPVPLVIVLHGASSSAKGMERYFGMDPVARREGFAVAYPQGIGKVWNDGRPKEAQRYHKGSATADDVLFLQMLTDDLVKRGIADPHRLYLTGMSNGGHMTSRMACQDSGRFAAYAPIVANLFVVVAKECKPSMPVPILIMNGTSDPINLWNGSDGGGKPDAAFFSTDQMVAFWTTVDKCTGQPAVTKFPDTNTRDKSTVQSSVYGTCADGTKVVLYTITGGGHQSPSAAGRNVLTSIMGQRNHDIEAAEEIWKFFSGYHR
ncbi:MAG TPA: PHB depolymerase family esterase [Nitrospiria bacterium]|nr:PHB depolymerase family esterase [Nitrospiria bacterium]